MGAIWRFVTDNQQVLGWLWGGLVVICGGIWAVAKFFLDRDKPKSVSATGGVAAGGDIRGSPITVTYTGESDTGKSGDGLGG